MFNMLAEWEARDLHAEAFDMTYPRMVANSS
jgi:hypothetical protein